MNRLTYLFLVGMFANLQFQSCCFGVEQDLPNVVLIFADDLGYGKARPKTTRGGGA